MKIQKVKTNMKHQYLAVSLLSLGSIVSGLVLASAKTTADQVVDRVAVSIPISCSILGDITSGEEHNAEIQNGIYQDDIGKTTLRVFCNDGEGFSIYAVGFTNNEYGNNKLTSNTLGTSHDITTGTATSGNASNWAMKLSTDSTVTYPLTIVNGLDDYAEVPSSYIKAATRLSGTDANVEGASLATTYAAYISSTQPADTYSGQVKYTLVHPSSEIPPGPRDTDPGYIAYYPNTITYEGSMSRQALSSTDTSATLTASNYSRSGYGFAGWNDEFDYTGNYYGPNEDIAFEAGQYTDGDKGLSLYAVWIKSQGTLQDWNGCSSLDIGSVTALTDSRDGRTYAVAKLADSKCWVIENMRIDDTVSQQDMFSGSTAIGEGFSTLPSSSDNWGTSSSTAVLFNNSNATNSQSSYGGYYSWPATVASTASFISGTVTANTSICPSGWRLPSGGQALVGSNNDYYILMKSLTNEEPNVNQVTGDGYYEGAAFSNSVRKYPNNYVFSGQWDSNSASGRGTSASYWTSTSYDGSSAYYLYLNPTIVRPGDGRTTYNKTRGNTFRCVTNN